MLASTFVSHCFYFQVSYHSARMSHFYVVFQYPQELVARCVISQSVFRLSSEPSKYPQYPQSLVLHLYVKNWVLFCLFLGYRNWVKHPHITLGWLLGLTFGCPKPFFFRLVHWVVPFTAFGLTSSLPSRYLRRGCWRFPSRWYLGFSQ